MSAESSSTTTTAASEPQAISLLTTLLRQFTSQQEDASIPTHITVLFNATAHTLSIFSSPPPGPAPLPPASQASLDSLRRILVTEAEKVEGGWYEEGCAVCLEEYDRGSEATEMPCRHVFHSMCLGEWLRMHNTCPVCRFALPAEEDVKDARQRGERIVWVRFLVSDGSESGMVLAEGSGHQSEGDNDGDGDHGSAGQEMHFES